MTCRVIASSPGSRRKDFSPSSDLLHIFLWSFIETPKDAMVWLESVSLSILQILPSTLARSAVLSRAPQQGLSSCFLQCGPSVLIIFSVVCFQCDAVEIGHIRLSVVWLSARFWGEVFLWTQKLCPSFTRSHTLATSQNWMLVQWTAECSVQGFALPSSNVHMYLAPSLDVGTGLGCCRFAAGLSGGGLWSSARGIFFTMEVWCDGEGCLGVLGQSL